ncbi:MAG: DUF3619 family protein [Nitrosomonas sp.]|nr:MAG: DUF3619 family protein [Nitrosomonas sp.]
MNEQEFGEKITAMLDQSAQETIKPSTLYRLQAARLAALAQCQPESPKVIHSGNGSSMFGKHWGVRDGCILLFFLTMIFLLTHVLLLQFWDNDHYAVIDAMILADDLPIDAYIDNEFEQWLNLD